MSRFAIARVTLAGLLGVALAFAIGSASNAATTVVVNPFSGQWSTDLGSGVTGTVKFTAISASAGAQQLQAMGGHLCGAPTTYYHGDFTDTGGHGGDTGTMTACVVTAGHLVGRYTNSDTSLTYPSGDLDVTLGSSKTTFSGFFTTDDPSFAGLTFPYGGAFQSHFPGDGCCITTPPPTTPPPTTTTTTPTTPTTPTGGGGSGGNGGGGACGASANDAAQPKKPCPPVSQAEKDAASDKNNRNLALMVVFCLFSDPDEKSDICSFVIDMASYVGQIQNDPPSPAFARVDVAQVQRANATLRLFCPRGCPGAAGAARGFVQALARVDAALAGLVTAANRYSGARLVSSATGMQLQAGVTQAYAGVLADALAALTGPATALANALSRAGVTTTLTSGQVSQGLTLLRNGLPAPYARRLPAGGDSATGLARSLRAAIGQPAGPVSFGQALALSPPPAAFRAASRTITVAELGAVVDQLGSQRAISKRARTLLHSDLNAITRAGNPAAHRRALARLRRDVGGLSRSVRGSTETLLQHGAAALS